MNKTYRSIWNASLGCYVAAPECASSHRSGTSATRVVRCRESLRSGIPMVLESRVLFDGAMVATVIEQDSASDAPVVEEAEPDAEDDTVAEAPAQPAATPAEDDEPAPQADADDTAVEEAVAEEPVADEAADDDESDTTLANPETAEAPRVEVVFVDARVPDVAAFEAPGREVIVLSMDQDGIAQIASALNGRTDIDAIHIVSHGGDGYLNLGSGQVTIDSIQSTQLQYLQAIGQSLSADGDILIYACDYASGASGLEAMNLLADITGADVSASVDATGDASLGADWTLERTTGTVEAVALAPTGWVHALDFAFTPVGSTGAMGLAETIMGAGITVTSATYQGGAEQSGTFTAGSSVTFGNNVLGFSAGALLSTSEYAEGVAGPNEYPVFGDDAISGVDGNAELNALSGGFDTFDAAILDITFVPDVPPGAQVGDVVRMTIEVVFGSDEYLEYVNGGFNDVMAIVVNGVNQSLVPNASGGESAISIDSVNNLQNPSLFVDNSGVVDGGTGTVTGAPYHTEMDGFTITIPLVFDVILGQENTLRVAIADTGDQYYDSWLFVRADSAQTAIVAEDDTITTATNLPATVDLTANDYNLAAAPMTLTHIQGQAVTQGQVIILESGVQLTVGAGGEVTVTGNGTDAVHDTFTYQISNGMGGVASATVDVDVTAPNLNPPVAQNDSEAVSANGTLSDSVLTDNGNGPDTDLIGDPLTVTQVNLTSFDPGEPTALPSGALLTMNSNGSYVYNPNGQFQFLAAGATTVDTFSYTVNDGQGGNDTATVSITITGVNDAPVAVDDSFSVGEDIGVGLGGILANDSDPDGDEIYIDMNSAAGSAGGQFSFDDSGILLFNPDGDFDDLAVGQSRTTDFTYTLHDSQGASAAATVTVTVNGANDNPQGTDDSFVGDEDSVLFLANLLGNDTDAEGDALYLDMNSTAGSNGGQFSRDDGGSVSFNPDGDFDDLAVGESRTTGFSYVVYDDQGGSGTATVILTVNGLNDNPTGVNDHFFASEDGLTTLGSLLINDSDVEGDGIYVALNSTPGGNGGQFSVDDGGSLVFNPDGDFDDLAVGESRDTSFNYMVYDDQGGQSSATVTVTVYGVNDNPVAVDDQYQVVEDGVTPLNSPLINDSDAEGNEFSLELNDLEGNNGGSISVGDAGELSFNPDGDFDDLATGESRTTSFTYTVQDSEGGSAVATVTVTVHGANDNPLAVNDAFTTQADTASFLGNLLNNDSDPEDDAVSVETIDGNTGSSGGIFTLDAAGDLHFNPNGDFDDVALGESRDTSVTYTVLDAFGGSTTGTVTVTVEGLNVTPVDPEVGGGETEGNSGETEGPVDPVDHSNEIVFVDPRVTDPDAFQADGREVILLTLDEDGLAQIAAALNGRTGIEAIHIISHGEEGALTLGNAQVNAASMQTTQLLSLQAIGQSLTLNGDILLYACDFAAGEMGLAAMSVLADITVADVAASLYITGHETLGADWSLEANVGTVETDEVVPNNWVYALSQASLGAGPVSSPVVAAPASPAAPVAPVVVPVESVAVSPAVADVGPVTFETTGVAFTDTAVRVTSMTTVAADLAVPASESGVQPILGFSMLDLETAFRQSLASATLAGPTLADALIEVGVETTTEWTQERVADAAIDQPAAHWVTEVATTDVLDLLPLEEVAPAESEGEAMTVITRPHAAQGFKAQLAKWAQWPAQRPITRAAVQG
ncbi:Ig-like domain-containing protein [Hydrogenophaga sp. A37]|uniref:Ig-like domain-containing protein n=1 Tax=Hydrogenophaga sp. A37 TaxID=1945864 RepID=UPI0009D0ADE5|nr:DUF4347 domain-containing protein [Hydrogenophaga sp. A37]OOG79218.1 hypothetical protein B0E41_25700 [Hydrogenophaga sp. A37]